MPSAIPSRPGPELGPHHLCGEIRQLRLLARLQPRGAQRTMGFIYVQSAQCKVSLCSHCSKYMLFCTDCQSATGARLRTFYKRGCDKCCSGCVDGFALLDVHAGLSGCGIKTLIGCSQRLNR